MSIDFNKFRRVKLLVTIFVAFAAFVAVMIWFSKDLPKRREPTVSNFEECAKAGYPVMESYPRQCSLPSGKFFVEELIPERR